MEIKTIGTGAISAEERSACTLVDNKILVDCGNGIVKTLLEQNVDIDQIDTLLITHLHGDHFLDIPFLIMQRNFDTASNELNVYCPAGTTEAVAQLIKIAYADISDWTVLRDKAKVKFIEFNSLDNQEVTEGYFVDSYIVSHGNIRPAYGFTIRHRDKVVGFSGDTAYCDSVERILENSDVAVLDSIFIESTEKHMGAHDIEKLAKKYNKKIIPTHMATPAREYLREKKLDNVVIARDGQVIKI